MSAPKYLALDADLQVVGMASAKEDFLRMGKFIGSKYLVYQLDATIPDREVVGLEKLVSKVVKNDQVADKS